MRIAALLVFTVAAVGAHAQSKKGYGYQSPTYTAPSYTYTAPSYGYGSNSSSHYVAPAIKSDGTYVNGHMRSNPNDTKLDNWSTKGNVNPYTGAVGTKDPYKF